MRIVLGGGSLISERPKTTLERTVLGGGFVRPLGGARV